MSARKHVLSLLIAGLLFVALAIIPAGTARADGASVLGPGQTLLTGQNLTASSGWMASMQEDGNLVVYAPGRVPRWSSATDHDGGVGVRMQDDGNLVVYNSSDQPLWSSGTGGNPGSEVRLQDDGNLVVYNADGDPIWSSDTKDETPPAVIRYAPVVYLSTGEEFRPTSVEDFLDGTSLYWHNFRGSDEKVVDSDELDVGKLGAGGYSHGPGPLDLRSAASNEHTRPHNQKDGIYVLNGFYLNARDKNRGGIGTNATVYYEYQAREYVTYWLFYAFNDVGALGNWDHEGDWENLTVRLDDNDQATDVAYYRHGGPCTKSWNDAPRTDTGHPIAYSARGTHATYDRVGSFNTHLRVYDADKVSKGDEWRTFDHLTDARAQPWYGYGGAWGEVGSSPHTTGPLGPGPAKGAAPTEEEWTKRCD